MWDNTYRYIHINVLLPRSCSTLHHNNLLTAHPKQTSTHQRTAAVTPITCREFYFGTTAAIYWCCCIILVPSYNNTILLDGRDAAQLAHVWVYFLPCVRFLVQHCFSQHVKRAIQEGGLVVWGCVYTCVLVRRRMVCGQHLPLSLHWETTDPARAVLLPCSFTINNILILL